jgi:hypothetical protein
MCHFKKSTMDEICKIGLILLIACVINSCVHRVVDIGDPRIPDDTTMSIDSFKKVQAILQKQADSLAEIDIDRIDYIRKTFLNNSTSPDYIVFTAIEENTSKNKEICCESEDLHIAFINDKISKQDKNSNSAMIEFENYINSNLDKIEFRFTKSESLKLIGFYTYSQDSIVKYSNDYTNEIILKIKKEYPKSRLLSHYCKIENIYMIHILNRNEIYCGRDCETGSIEIRKVIK